MMINAELTQLEFFQGLTASDIDQISEIIQAQTFNEDDIIVQEGDEVNKDLYIITKGSVVAKIETNNEDNANINVMTRGQIFGELSLISDIKRSATIEATSETELLCIPKTQFLDLISKNNHLGMIIYRNIANVLSDRIRKTNKLLKHTITWGW